jgi:hypothetical protein
MIPRDVHAAALSATSPFITALICALALSGWLLVPPALAQTYTPQSASALSVTFSVERVGSGRVILFGDVRNGSSTSYERVVLLAEGLDEQGTVVSRGRAYVTGEIPGRGSAPFECRIPSGGREKRFRVTVEAYQIAGQSP